MADKASNGSESTGLDPEDWDAFRALCHSAVDDMIDHWASVRDRPVWQPIPEAGKAALEPCTPLLGKPASEVYETFRERIMPHLLGNTHPRFWGWVHGSGTPVGALAEFLAGCVNANLGGREHMPVYLERQVIDTFKSVFGLPAAASGLLVSGTSMATLLGLAVARERIAPGTIRSAGLAAAGRELVGYCSTQAHSCAAKAFEVLGLGSSRLRKVKTDAAHGIDLEALEQAIRADRAAGSRPFVVIASAGTVNIGAFDDISAIRGIADRHDLWLHVDGAFGALAMLAPALRHLVAGIETADSLAFDCHKWLHVPYDAGCLLVRDGQLHRATFGGRLEYLSSAEVGAASGEPWFCDYGIELSRGFRALKVWFTLEHYGLARLGEAICRNCEQARHLARLVDAEPRLERVAPVPLNIVCLRHRGSTGSDPVEQEHLTKWLTARLHLEGVAVPSLTTIDGRTAMRVCLTNHRTTTADLEAFVAALLSFGEERASRSA